MARYGMLINTKKCVGCYACRVACQMVNGLESDEAFIKFDEMEQGVYPNEYAEVASQYIADTMATDKPNIMSTALVPSNPVSPNKTRNIMLGFLLGGILAAGIITVRMLINDTYKTSEDIRRYTGLVTLAVIPVEDQDSNGKRRKKQSRREV